MTSSAVPTLQNSGTTRIRIVIWFRHGVRDVRRLPSGDDNLIVCVSSQDTCIFLKNINKILKLV